ncbi:MAG: efflux RND transporter permease subunit [Fibrobacterota bacterium]|nr:efflux RND transporter permease subunit [Fibrobacterota bacterium]
MLNAIILFSLRNRLLVVALSALLLVYGTYVLTKLPVDVFPDLNRPTVTIQAEAAGLSPEEIEALVVYPMETALNGATGVERVRSVSAPGLGLVFVEFGWNTDIYIDRQIVAEKLQGIREALPDGVNPTLGPISSIMGEIMLVSVSGDSLSPMELRTLADWTIKPRLLSIPGVSQVIAIGGDLKQYHVLVNPDKLRQNGVTLHEVESAVKETNTSSSGGFLIQDYTESVVRNLGRLQSLDDLKSTVVAFRDGQSITLDQVADIGYGTPQKRGTAGTNAKPAVILTIKKQPGASTIELTGKIDLALAELQKGLPKGVTVNPRLFRQSVFIETAIENVEHALRDGSILVIVVLFLFLLNFRTTFITLTAIPLSILITALVFRFFDISINTMTLGGLAVAIGELVDDAIVDVENVFRRLKENRHKANPEPYLHVIYKASSEVRNSIVFATLIVVLVFIPLFSLGGIEGRIFAPLGIAYIISILASLVVSLTVTPALCAYLLPKARFLQKEADSALVRFMKKWNRKILLEPTLGRPWLALGLAFLLLVAALASFPFLGKEFLPPFNEGTATINILSPPGTSLAESDRIGTIGEKLVLKVPEVVSTGRRTGRAEEDDHAEGVHYSEIDVDLKPSNRDREEILADIRNNLAQIPGVAVSIGQPISHRIDHLLSGIRAQVAVKVYGDDLLLLREKAAQIEKELEGIPGVVDLSVEKQVLVPQVEVLLNREELKRFGLKTGEVTELIQTALSGEKVSEVLEDQKRFALVVLLNEESRANLESIGELLIDVPGGEQIPLNMVATVQPSMGPNQILRENVRRRIVIQCNTSGRDLGSVVQDIQKTIHEKVELPSGYFIEYGGQFESQQQASRKIGFLSIFSLIGMALALYMHFRSVNLVGLILLNIPFALIGAVLAIWLTTKTFSIGSLVGFVTLCGISSRNGIMMISHYLHLLREEGETWSREMVIRGALERLVPVLMTALTAALALVPLMWSPGEPGKEILYPVAVVIFGGLVSSTLMNMALMPTLFWNFSRKSVNRLLEKGQDDSDGK